MKCADARAMAESYLAGELPVDTNHDVISHLERCADCRAELDARQALRTTLRRAVLESQALAPAAAFVERVRSRLLRDDAPRRRAFGVPAFWLAIAASVAVVAALGWQLRGDRAASALSALAALAAEAAGDHQACALHHALDEPPIPLDEAAQRYNPAYADLVDVVSRTAPVRGGAVDILGAHWCVFRGRAFAHVIVRHRGQVVSILLTPIDAVPSTPTPASACPASDSFQVACFDARGHAGFVVSDLTAGENLALARDLAPMLQAHLGQG
jgi:hypothetical protein